MIRVNDNVLSNETKARFQLVAMFVGTLFILLGVRSWYLQIFQGKKYKQFSEENRIELKKIPAMRGRILDRNGTVLADSRASFDLTVTRQYVLGDLKETIHRLGAILRWKDTDEARALQKIKGFHASESVAIKNDLSRDELAQILVRQYSLPGVDVIHTPARSYPFGDHGSHVLGYLSEIEKPEFEKLKKDKDTKYALGDVWGISGVEKKYDLTVKGENGSEPYVEDARGRQIGLDVSGDLLPAFQRKEPVRGKDLMLTIDSRVQEAAELAFTHDSGAVVAMDPNNGDILAYLSRPEYSPARFVRGVSSEYWAQLLEDPRNPLYDRALRGLYPPGSTFKFVTAIAALEEKVTHPGETVFCPGHYRIGREVKSCWKKSGHGYMNLHNAIKHSCDVYFYEMGRRLGVDRIAKYAKGFGMGQTTGIGINREVNGLVPTEAWKKKVYRQPWVGGETLSVAIGQGFLQITPIQLSVGLSSLLNGGKVFQPRIVLKSQDEKARVSEEFPEKIKSRVQLDAKNIADVIGGLVGVVNEEGGTAYWTARSTSIKIGGKTGTAQTVGKASGIKREDHAWFIAFAPADHPKIVVTVIVEYGGHGGVTAAPIAKKVIEAYLGGTS